MLEGNGILMVIGSTIALLLMVVGGAFGFRFGRRKSSDQAQVIDDGDRERMLQLLQELSSWTSEYSGNVSDYQNQLGELSAAVRDAKSPAPAGNRVVVLLKRIMETNDNLQVRLDAAEQQLDKQTEQIESYLTEARTDGLTGLLNRRAFDQRLEELFAAFRKGGRSFVVVLIDVDHFKNVNDTYGHQVGDQVLQQIARAIKNHLADALIVARFGGEEFAVIVNGPLRMAAQRLNEMRKQMASDTIDVGTSHIDVTVSVGLSEPRDDIVPSPVIRRADEALYAAKNIGRNRVYYHDGRGPTLVGAPEVARDSSVS